MGGGGWRGRGSELRGGKEEVSERSRGTRGKGRDAEQGKRRGEKRTARGKKQGESERTGWVTDA